MGTATLLACTNCASGAGGMVAAPVSAVLVPASATVEARFADAELVVVGPVLDPVAPPADPGAGGLRRDVQEQRQVGEQAPRRRPADPPDAVAGASRG